MRQPGRLEVAGYTLVDWWLHPVNLQKMTAPSKTFRQDLTAAPGVASGMAEDRVVRPTPFFAARLLELAASAGISPEELLDEVGLRGESTLERFRAGRGSPKFAMGALAVLKQKKVDVSRLPRMDEQGPVEAEHPTQHDLDEWEREWLALGRTLRRSVSQEWWDENVERRVLDIARAHARIEEGQRSARDPSTKKK